MYIEIKVRDSSCWRGFDIVMGSLGVQFCKGRNKIQNFVMQGGHFPHKSVFFAEKRNVFLVTFSGTWNDFRKSSLCDTELYPV